MLLKGLEKIFGINNSRIPTPIFIAQETSHPRKVNMSNNLVAGVTNVSRGRLSNRGSNILNSGVENLLRLNQSVRGAMHLRTLLGLKVPALVNSEPNILTITPDGTLCVTENSMLTINARLTSIESRMSIVETTLDDALMPGGGLS